MARWRQGLGFLAMTLVTLVVAHNSVFLLAYGAGYDEALAHSGHDGAWGTAVAVVLAAACGLAGLGIWRLHRLAVDARSGAPGGGSLRPALLVFALALCVDWARLLAATSVLFVVQENLEHHHAGEPLPGLSVLGSAQYPNALLIIAATAFAVAFVVVLFRWRRDALAARIAAARRAWQRVQSTDRRREAPWIEHRHASIVVHQVSGRAPPVPGAA